MKLRYQRFYKDKRGDFRGPMDQHADDIFVDQYGNLFHGDGRMYNHAPQSAANLISEVAAREITDEIYRLKEELSAASSSLKPTSKDTP